jgi:hypothetical protein
MNESTQPETNTVNVRWWDGYLETFEAVETRFGCDLLWMRLADGGNRHIPLRGVRWWSLSKESHGTDWQGATA